MDLNYRGRKQRVFTDVFNVSGRLRELNKNYYLMYDVVTNRYEVHNDEYKPATLAFSIPYDRLDARTVEYVAVQMGKRPYEVLEEIERNNERIEREYKERQLDVAQQKTKEVMDYVNRHESEEHIPQDAFTTKWV